MELFDNTVGDMKKLPSYSNFDGKHIDEYIVALQNATAQLIEPTLYVEYGYEDTNDTLYVRFRRNMTEKEITYRDENRAKEAAKAAQKEARDKANQLRADNEALKNLIAKYPEKAKKLLDGTV